MATTGFLLPAAALMTAAAVAAAALPDAAWVRGGLLGVQVAVVGQLAHGTAGLLAKEARTPLLAVLAAAAAAAGLFVNAAVVIAAAGLVGVAVEYRQRPRPGTGGA